MPDFEVIEPEFLINHRVIRDIKKRKQLVKNEVSLRNMNKAIPDLCKYYSYWPIRMKNIKLAFTLFGLGYLIATIVGFSTYYIHITVMWIATMTLMPVIFGYLFYIYLRRIKCTRSESIKQTNYLILFWIILSFLLDALVFIIVVPIIFGNPSNWTFFLDQSPWIWLNYFAIIILGYISRFFYLRSLKNKLTN
jgi:hypothetical protein